MSIESGGGGLTAIFILPPTGNRNENRMRSDLRLLIAYSSRHFIAVDIRQADIEQNDVGSELRRGVHCPKTIECRIDFMAEQGEHLFQAENRIAIVVNNQDA